MVNIDQILGELKYNTGVFPRQALHEAIARKSEITPALLQIIEDAKGLPAEIYAEDYWAHIYAMYLLAQFRERWAYQPIVEFFSIPGEVTLDLTGDVVTEDLSRILASVSRGDASLIKSLVENSQANEYVRSAALDALLVKVVCGEATRQEVMDYYESLFRGSFARESPEVCAFLVSASTDLYPDQVIGDIRKAYEEGLVDEGYIDRDFVEEAFAGGMERALSALRGDRRRRLITDVVTDME